MKAAPACCSEPTAGTRLSCRDSRYTKRLKNFTEAGLTPYDVIETGTRSAAEFLSALDEFGTVTVGSRADLILVEANPLDDVKNIGRRIGVMVRRKWYTEADLRSRLEDLAVRYSR